MPRGPKTQSEAVTDGVRITVESEYMPQHSAPAAQRYVFAYHVRIQNTGSRLVQLISRHWVVTHGDGHVEEVEGPGVVGEQPRLGPGDGFRYSSGCVLRTPRGSMHGTYQMVPTQGDPFDASIAPFVLEVPYSLN